MLSVNLLFQNYRMEFIFDGGECGDPTAGDLKKDFENLLWHFKMYFTTFDLI